MKVGDICNRSVIIIDEEDSALSAAQLMREFHVGDVIIVRASDGRRVPTGIVTDRDLVLEIMALSVDPDKVAVKELFSGPKLVSAQIDDDLEETLDAMRAHGVRRMPVVERDGSLAGIVTVDDVLDQVTDQLTDIVRLVAVQQRREQRLR